MLVCSPQGKFYTTIYIYIYIYPVRGTVNCCTYILQSTNNSGLHDHIVQRKHPKINKILSQTTPGEVAIVVQLPAGSTAPSVFAVAAVIPTYQAKFEFVGEFICEARRGQQQCSGINFNEFGAVICLLSTKT